VRRLRRLAALVALFLASCAVPLSQPSATSPGVTATATSPPVATASVVAATATATPRTFAPLLVFNPPPLHGDWVFALNGGIEAGGGRRSPFIGELWAAPLAGGAPVLVAQYLDRQEGGAGLVGTNDLRRQISSDGRRVVLSVGAGARFRLVLIDLDRGAVTLLGPDDVDLIRPALSPDGTRVAFVRKPGAEGDDGLWLIGADGAGMRQLRPGVKGLFTWIFGWTGDSRRIAFDQVESSASYVVLDVTTGAVSSAVGFTTLLYGHPADWRSASPSFVAGVADAAFQGEYRIVVADRADEPQRVLVRETNRFLLVGVPRWNPITDEILYRRLIGIGRIEYYIVRSSGGDPVRVPLSVTPYIAEWTPDGGSIVYVAADQMPYAFYGASIHIARRDGTGDRELFAAPRGGLTDLFTVRYP